MGGSGIVGDVIYSLAYSMLDTPVTVVKDFKLPKWVGKNSLVCVVSYSGNTLESINTALEAINAGAEVCVVASGGKLLKLARSKGLTYVKVDEGLAPRAAFPLLLIATLKVLESYGIKVIKEIRKLPEVLKYVPSVDSISRELALFIRDSLPTILSNATYYPVALRFKNELNENSKIMAKVEVVPEWGHNDIVGWEGVLSMVKAVVLDDGDPLISFVDSYLRSINVSAYVLKLEGDDVLSKMLYGIYVAGLTSIYLAEVRGVNPIITKSIERYKEFLTRTYSVLD